MRAIAIAQPRRSTDTGIEHSVRRWFRAVLRVLARVEPPHREVPAEFYRFPWP